MGLFINVQIDPRAVDKEAARQVAAVCPVDVFRVQNDRLSVVSENVDECTLCALCLDKAPIGGVRIFRRYGRGEELLPPSGDGLQKGTPATGERHA